MKTSLLLPSILLLATFQSRAGIVTGPVTNPANGHDYYLLSPNTWTASEAEAESLGGTLAIIKNAGEQKWVFSTFGPYPGVNHGGLWIGLHRTRPAGPFAWVTDEKLDYVNWDPGEPNNVGGVENCAHMQNGDSNHGAWNDLADNNLLFGVVELPGKVNEISLSEPERALIGDWYEGGKVERPCWIVGTDSALFVILNNKFAARAGCCADGSLFVPGFRGGWPMTMRGFDGFGSMPVANPQSAMRGEIMKDRILWSNGTWWSRRPVEHGKNGKFSDGDAGSAGSQN